MLKIVELEKQLMQTNKELDQIRVSVVTMETTVLATVVTDMKDMKLHFISCMFKKLEMC